MDSSQKTPAQRGWRTLGQNTLGAIIGLLLAVWNTPGVPETISQYAQHNFVPLLLAFVALIGIPGALISYAQNRIEAAGGIVTVVRKIADYLRNT